jgi:Bacterial PH domain
VDNEPGRAPVVRFGPDRRVTALAGIGLLAALTLAVVGSDPAGRLLAAIAVVVLLAYVVSDLWFHPRLTASGDGLTIRAPTTRAQLPWRDVERVQADTRLRLGLRTTTLEIDAGATLVVFSRRALGADPETVAELVNAFRPR